MSIYSKTVEFSIAAGTIKCIELPAMPRGFLKRLIITQISGAAIGATFKIYDRKGASVAATDIEVADSGEITAYATEGGKVKFTVPAGHSLRPGDVIEIKNSPNAAFNVQHTVTTILSDTVFATNIDYGVPTAIGTPNPKMFYQTLPLLPTQKPVTHTVHTGTVVSGTDFVSLDLSLPYENRDNQNISKTRNTALWLEFITTGSGAASTWQVSVTTEDVRLT